MDVPSVHAVTPYPGPSDGHELVVNLKMDPSLPRELLPDLIDHYERTLPRGAVLSEDVSWKLRCQGVFAKIVFAGVRSMTEALQQARQLTNWFFQCLAPNSVKRAEKCRRQTRSVHKTQCKRRSRYESRHWCRQYIGYAGAF